MKKVTKEVKGVVTEATVSCFTNEANYKIKTENPMPYEKSNVKIVYDVDEPETILEFLNHTGIDESIIVEFLNKTYLR